jgi:hypothetical protein
MAPRDPIAKYWRYAVAALAAALTVAATPPPALAQQRIGLSHAQRWEILGCYNDMAWDSSACRRAGVEKRGEFFHGPLGTNDPSHPDFDEELVDLLADCGDENDGYCAESEGEGKESTTQAQAVSSWRFEVHRQDSGTACSLETRAGDVVVGFATIIRGAYRGSVSGLIKKPIRATWRVDEGSAVVVDGALATQSKWYMASDPPLWLLDDLAQGRQLAVTSANGERVVVNLQGVRQPLAQLRDCINGRYDTGTEATQRPFRSAADALTQTSASNYTCAFRMSEMDGFEAPPGMMTDRAYLRSLQITRMAITFNLRSEQFLIGNRPVEGAEFVAPNDRLPEGAVTVSFRDFHIAMSRTAADNAAVGLSEKDREALNFIMGDISGAASQLIAPSRRVVFDAAQQGRLLFFDQSEPSAEATNFSRADCRRL